jgi:hypothetical protein
MPCYSYRGLLRYLLANRWHLRVRMQIYVVLRAFQYDTKRAAFHVLLASHILPNGSLILFDRQQHAGIVYDSTVRVLQVGLLTVVVPSMWNLLADAKANTSHSTERPTKQSKSMDKNPSIRLIQHDHRSNFYKHVSLA